MSLSARRSQVCSARQGSDRRLGSNWVRRSQRTRGSRRRLVADTRYRELTSVADIYLPYAHGIRRPAPPGYLAFRGHGPARSWRDTAGRRGPELAPPLCASIGAASAAAPLARPRFQPRRRLLCALALLLSVIGTTARCLLCPAARREIGIRMALGAARRTCAASCCGTVLTSGVLGVRARHGGGPDRRSSRPAALFGVTVPTSASTHRHGCVDDRRRFHRDPAARHGWLRVLIHCSFCATVSGRTVETFSVNT